MQLRSVFAIILLSASTPLFSQAVPTANEGGLPLVVGAGFSDYNSDWNGRINGGTLWIDWNFDRGPSLLSGLGIELEGRDLNYGRTGSVPNLRQDSFEGGVIYTWRQYHTLHPYAKFLLGYGHIDFQHLTPTYSQDSRTMFTPGGGIEYRAWRNVWVRGDYEYQSWTSFFNYHDLNPEGFTVGVSYDFGYIHAR